jgi:phosphoribosylformylglycinamidine cyclo-ligase
MTLNNSNSAYTQAGVDIAAGQRATDLMKVAVEATYTPQVLAGLGNFGGLFDVSAFKEMDAPILVASTDGVGTKTKVAARLGRWDTIGYDIVNHCVNDILVQGARPLFFLDYVASSKLHPEQIATIVGGIAAACQAAGCALLGGETAEMPGVYEAGEIDLVGTVIGVVDRPKLIDGSRIQPGDRIIALPSSGPHTNGYTLIRKVLGDLDWSTNHAELDATIGDALLAPHRSYLADVQRLLSIGVDVRGLAHITGGGIVDNLPRILPDGVGAQIERGTWPEPPIFGLIQRMGGIADADMFHAFNMGAGMLVIVPEGDVDKVQAAVAQGAVGQGFEIGRIVSGAKRVQIDG